MMDLFARANAAKAQNDFLDRANLLRQDKKQAGDEQAKMTLAHKFSSIFGK